MVLCYISKLTQGAIVEWVECLFGKMEKFWKLWVVVMVVHVKSVLNAMK